MEKRYQVFVSSTYADLQDERRQVTQTLMELDCIPAGMEIFPAADEEQWAFIRKVIDDCDYYLLIVGGRYGSTTPEGISYTEKEYDYAVQRGLQVLAFIHGRPKDIPVGRSDVEADARAKLTRFRERVAHGRLVKFWTKAEELPGLVALSLPKTIKAHPAVGWVRATAATSIETFAELNELRKKVSELGTQLARARAQAEAEPLVDGLVPLTDSVRFSGSYQPAGRQNSRDRWTVDMSWRDAFSTIGPFLLASPTEGSTKSHLTHLLFRRFGAEGYHSSLDTYDFETLKMQLAAHGLVKFRRTDGSDADGSSLTWSLTSRGTKLLFESRTIRRSEGKD